MLLRFSNDRFRRASLVDAERGPVQPVQPELLALAACDELEQLFEESRFGQLAPEESLRGLALVGWIRRASESLCRRFERWDSLRQSMDAELRNGGALQQIEAGLRSFDPDQWCERLRKLERAVSQTDEQLEAEKEARWLLQSLDDVELAWGTACAADKAPPRLAAAFGDMLTRCSLLLQSHPDLFLSCSTWIQATAGGFRPGIEDDPFLGPSAMKFIVLLDELERFEAFTKGSPLPEIDEDRSAELAELRKQSKRLRKLMGRSGEPEVQQEPELFGTWPRQAEPLLAARGVPERSQSTELVFDSPDGKYRGQILIPGRLARGVQVKAGFFAVADGRPASALLGRFAKIGDEQAMIDVNLDGEVVAVFSLATVVKALSGTPRLIVEEEEWKTSN